MKANDFKKLVKSKYPEAIIKVKTVNFMDLARASAKFVTISGIKWTPEERDYFKAKAREADLILN